MKAAVSFTVGVAFWFLVIMLASQGKWIPAAVGLIAFILYRSVIEARRRDANDNDHH